MERFHTTVRLEFLKERSSASLAEAPVVDPPQPVAAQLLPQSYAYQS